MNEEKVTNKNLRSTQSYSEIKGHTIGFENEDQQFWWKATAPSLERLLANSGYPESDQLEHLLWYHKYIIKALGPRPKPGEKPLFEPCPVFDGSAVEHSINWREKDPARTVRFTIEAVGREAGTAADPYNQEASISLLKTMSTEDSQLDLQRFDIFANALFLSPATAGKLLPSLPPSTPLSQIWLAFDLLRGKIMVKAYFMPILKWLDEKVPTKDLVFATIRNCGNQYGSFDGTLELLNQYFASFPVERLPVIEMVAVDCIDSPNARIKCYLRTGVNTLAKAKDQFALGGRLRGKAIERGLQALEDLWPILFRLESDDIEHVEVFPGGNYCGCAIEMKPNQDTPQTKLHIPVRKIVGTDSQLCESLSAWMKQRGDGKFAAVYKDQLSDAFPNHKLDTTGGTHTFVSFSYTEKHGVYMTMYYSTRILELYVDKNRGDIWSGYDNLWIERGGLTHHTGGKPSAVTA